MDHKTDPPVVPPPVQPPVHPPLTEWMVRRAVKGGVLDALFWYTLIMFGVMVALTMCFGGRLRV